MYTFIINIGYSFIVNYCIYLNYLQQTNNVHAIRNVSCESVSNKTILTNCTISVDITHVTILGFGTEVNHIQVYII